MSTARGYPIEEFLEAITAQLDQTQDALRLKAVNRPLTFALKDFNVDLKVFVEMDQEGRVTFRPAMPNEEGASTVSIGFTTITRPMIEENTISMEMANAPTLDELGLGEGEARQLARVGVRNAAQLRNFEASAGDEGLSRHSGVNLGRIRSALNLARPRLHEVVDPEGPTATTPPPQQTGPPAPPPQTRPPAPPPPQTRPPASPPVREPPVARPPAPGRGEPRPWLGRPAPLPIQPLPAQGHPRPGTAPTPAGSIGDRLRGAGARRKLDVGPSARSIDLKGANLIDRGRAPVARLDGARLDVLGAQPSSVSFALPEGWNAGPGRLSVEMPDGAVEHFDLSGGAGQ